MGPEDVQAALTRLKGVLHRTPCVRSSLLDSWLGHEIWFKCENQQRVGAFKARGAYNTLSQLNPRPARVVAVSSGNHSQAVAWAGRELDLPVELHMSEDASPIKRQATAAYGAQIHLHADRVAAEVAAMQAAQREGSVFVPPFDHDHIIAGQGTACLEALTQMPKPEAIFCSVGGGGWLSGTWLAAQSLEPAPAVYGAEPAAADDAARSVAAGHIIQLPETPDTLADGVRTRSLTPRTFAYVRQCAGILTVSETRIVYWTQWLTHLLKQAVEPSSALAMAACAAWLREQSSPQRVLVLLSGGNLDPSLQRRIWSEDHLQYPPAA